MKMRQLLEERIRAVFPKGNDWEHDDKELDANSYVQRINCVIKNCSSLLPLSVKSERWSGHLYDQFMFTHSSAPDFDSWVFAMDNAAKIKWIQENNCPYVVLLVKVSRVADYFITYFNHWRPRENTGYLDADFREEPNQLWKDYARKVFDQLKDQGFLLATREFLNEEVPFVLTWGGDAIPNDDPRWDDDEFEPEPVLAVMYDCLFGDQ